MLFPEARLPKVYIVKQSRSDLNELTSLEVINGPTERMGGARMSFREALVAEVRAFQAEKKDDRKKFKVKLAGDGAAMTRNTSFELFVFSLLDWGRSILRLHMCVLLLSALEKKATRLSAMV